MITVQGMILGELLRQHGIASAANPVDGSILPASRRGCCGRGVISPVMRSLQRLAAMAIDPQDLAKLERAKPPKHGRRRKGHPGTRSTGEEGEDRSRIVRCPVSTSPTPARSWLPSFEKYADYFQQLQRDARQAEVGCWKAP
jgi:hypothetical protein